MNHFLTISDYSQEVTLKGKEFCEKENKSLKYQLFLPIIISCSFMYVFFILHLDNPLCFIMGLIPIYLYYVIIRIWRNYKTQKHLQNNIKGYSFSVKNLWNTDWNNPILLEKWYEKVNNKLSIKRISLEKITISLSYYKNKQSSGSIFTIELFLLLLNTMLILFSQKENNITPFGKEISILVTIFLFLVKTLYIYYQKNKAMDDNSYRRMQFLCEYLLQKRNKHYCCNTKHNKTD